jgi:hypothetical protein
MCHGASTEGIFPAYRSENQLGEKIALCYIIHVVPPSMQYASPNLLPLA